MRTLTNITTAVRRGRWATVEELRYAVAAYDVLVAKLGVEREETTLAEFFAAAESDPREYIGWENDPQNPEFVRWHEERAALPDILKRARGLL
jgi:hypothetical protein